MNADAANLMIVTCAACGQTQVEAAGAKFECSCGNRLTAPLEDQTRSEWTLPCTNCWIRVRLRKTLSTCPVCNERMSVQHTGRALRRPAVIPLPELEFMEQKAGIDYPFIESRSAHEIETHVAAAAIPHPEDEAVTHLKIKLSAEIEEKDELFGRIILLSRAKLGAENQARSLESQLDAERAARLKFEELAGDLKRKLKRHDACDPDAEASGVIIEPSQTDCGAVLNGLTKSAS